jgi:hypothetical protein
MSFKTVLEDVVTKFKTVLVAVTGIAKAEEPVVDALFPGVAVLFNSTVTVVGAVEAAATAAGAQTGTGVQKAAIAAPAVTALVNAYLTSNSIETTATAAQVSSITSAVVAFLNALPTTGPVATPGGG